MMKALFWRKMDPVYFDALETRLRYCQETDRPFTLLDSDETVLVQTVFDYEKCRLDFGLTCRCIGLFSGLVSLLDFSHTHMAILSNIFILSTFLKNRLASKISKQDTEILKGTIHWLEQNFSNIIFDSRLHFIDIDRYDSGRLLMALTYLNIYDSSSALRTSPVSPMIAAYLLEINSVKLHADSANKYFAIYAKNRTALVEAFEFSTECQTFKRLYNGHVLNFKKELARIITIYMTILFVLIILISMIF